MESKVPPMIEKKGAAAETGSAEALPAPQMSKLEGTSRLQLPDPPIFLVLHLLSQPDLP